MNPSSESPSAVPTYALAIPLEVVPKEIENEWVQLALQAANKSNTILT